MAFIRVWWHLELHQGTGYSVQHSVRDDLLRFRLRLAKDVVVPHFTFVIYCERLLNVWLQGNSRFSIHKNVCYFTYVYYTLDSRNH
jgi:hypothetical protein